MKTHKKSAKEALKAVALLSARQAELAKQQAEVAVQMSAAVLAAIAALADEHEENQDEDTHCSSRGSRSGRKSRQSHGNSICVGSRVLLHGNPYGGQRGTVTSRRSAQDKGPDTYWYIKLDTPDSETGNLVCYKMEKLISLVAS